MPLSEFDFSLLESREFKEDSVREELISPLLKKLGYAASGLNRIIRSKTLKHPFVYIGTKQHKVKIIPDYVLEIDGTTRWVLDAKAPWENIHGGSNVEQVFSYSIHPDVRAFVYALCNGRSLVVYHVNKVEPILDINFRDIDVKWTDVEGVLSPLAFTNPSLLRFKPDFGLYNRKLGISSNVIQHFDGLGLSSIYRLRDDLYSAFLNIDSGGEWYALSLDFSGDVYKQLLQVVHPDFARYIEDGLSAQPYKIVLGAQCPVVDVTARLGEDVITNGDQSYLPLVVDRFDPH